MEALFESRQFATSPKAYWTIKYEHRRVGADMQYRFYWNVWLGSSGSWWYNAFKLPINLNGTNVVTIQVKTYNDSEKGWNKSGTTDWYTVSGKTSGTVPFYAQLVDTGGYAQASWNVQDTSPTYNLTVDPAGSDLGSIANFTIGNAITIPITKYSTSFVDNLVIKYGSTSIKTVSNISNGASVSFTTSELNTIYSLMSTVNSGTFSFTLSTYDGSTLVGSSSQTATGSITNANPTFTASNISYQDSNNTTYNVTQNRQHLVQNLSNLLVTISSATGNKGASITKYEATINGVMKSRTSAGNIDFGVINSGSNLTLSVKVTDSRGNTTTATKTVIFLAWSLPTGVISLKRKNNYEDTSYLKVQATYSSINSKNTITIKYQYKKTTDSSYSSQTTISNNTEKTISLSKSYAWDFKITLTDKFGTTTYNTVLAKGQFILFVDTKKLSVGVNCFPTQTESLEVNGEKIGAIDFKKIYPVGSIYLSVNSTSPATLFGGSWTQISNRFLYCTTSGATGTGGASSVSYTPAGTVGGHTLTVSEIPSHCHGQKTIGNDGNINPWVGPSSGSSQGVYTRQQSAWYNSGHQNVETYNTGGGGSHNHGFTGTQATISTMPPYIKVYAWYRTA